LFTFDLPTNKTILMTTNHLTIKHILVCLIMALFLIVSCESDDYIKNPAIENSDATVIKTISLNDLQSNPSAYAKIQKYLGTKSAGKERLIYNADYGFTIDTDNIVNTQANGYNYYMFNISREQDNGYVERLYLHPQADDSYLAFLVQYKLTQSEIDDLANGKTVEKLNEKTLYTPLDKIDTGSLLTTFSVSSYVTVCDYLVNVTAVENEEIIGSHPGEVDGTNDGHTYTYVYTYSLIGCNFVFSNVPIVDMPTTPGNGAIIGQVGTNPLNPDTTITVPPVLTIDLTKTDDAFRKKHLNSLTTNKSNGTKTNIKQRIDELKQQLPISKEENGTMFNAAQDRFESNSHGGNFTNWFGHPLDYFITLHMHQDQYYDMRDGLKLKPSTPVYSPTDIINCLLLYHNTKNIRTTAMLVSRIGTYALMIDDAAKAEAAVALLSPEDSEGNISEARKKFDDDYDKEIFNVTTDAEQRLAIIKFINTVKVNGKLIGISLYQASYDAHGNIIDWVKL